MISDAGQITLKLTRYHCDISFPTVTMSRLEHHAFMELSQHAAHDLQAVDMSTGTCHITIGCTDDFRRRFVFHGDPGFNQTACVVSANRRLSISMVFILLLDYEHFAGYRSYFINVSLYD